jgi:hypothetical protein
MNAITKFSMINTVNAQKTIKYSLGQELYITIQYMLHVTYQLFTTIMWKRVTKEAPKSLKFIR